jgi:hypothetical protein
MNDAENISYHADHQTPNEW